MLEDANPVETTPTPETAPESQPAQGSDTPAVPQAPAEVTPQGREQQPPMIPKHRFDELNHRMQAAEARLREMGQPPRPEPAAPQAPKQEDFATYEDYIRADARFVAQQEARQAYAAERQREQQAAQQQAEQFRLQNAQQNWNQKTSEAAAKYPDFEQKLFMAPKITNDYTSAVLMASPMAGELAYHLASNPETVTRLNGMHPLDAAAELGRIEGKLQGSSGQPVKKPSAGIPALNPVGTGNKPAAVDPYALETSVEDYVRATRPPPRRNR